MTPQQALLIVGDIAYRFNQFSNNISALSYPETPKEFHSACAVVLRQVSEQYIRNDYDVVLWKNEIRNAALRGFEAFIGEEMSVESFPPGNTWWIYDEPLGFSSKDYPDLVDILWWKENYWGCAAHYVYPSERKINNLFDKSGYATIPSHGMIAIWFPSHRDDQIRITWDPGIPYGDRIPAQMASIIAMQQFLEMPFVCMQRESPNHTIRKKSKAYKRLIPNDIKVVSLRRREYHGQSHDGEGTREYTCQWLVSGHWRKLHKMRKDGVRVVYVQPYVKGPEGMPLKSNTRRIYVANK